MAPEDPPSARPRFRNTRPRSRGWITSGLVAVIAAGAFVFISSHTPAATPATPNGPASGLDGSLIYAAQDPQGWVLWTWDLRTGQVAPGPHVEQPTDLVDASSVSPGWVGVTSSEGRRQVASILHFLTPEGRAIRVAAGDLVTWSSGGQDVTSLRSGDRTQGCLRHVVIANHLVSFGTSDVRYDGPMCGLPLKIARDGTFIYVVAARGTTASIVFVGGGYTERFIDDHAMVSLSTRGDFLLTPVSRPGAGHGGGPPDGLQLYYRSPSRSGPVPFGRRHQPLLVDEFLTWSWDAGDAYVLGLYRGVRGVYRITMAPGIGLRVPELLDRTDAATIEATVTSDGDLILLQDGELSTVRAGELRPLTLPPGAPRPAGPLLWSAPSLVPSGSAS
ncbi:MAG: hypothetical protein M3P10_08640 [Actinomycetota bacterium]|nr:hypothetical protein [Actinomycetota bacterium]MDP9328261.1 hypothetical protein [Actinomycetota bacterium]